MAKGYWIARVDVSDTERYQLYVAAVVKIFAEFGARYVIRGGRYEAPEGTHRSRNIVIEFPDYETALACYRSPQYTQAIGLRSNAASVDLAIVEGFEGPQPG